MLKFLTCLFTSLIFLSSVAFAKNSTVDQMKECPGSDKHCPKILDFNLKQCIANSTRKPFESLSDEDYLKITFLGCAGKNIESITGIENFANLKEIDLMNNQISDISSVAGLSRLSKLYLWGNQVSDVSPLASLNQLKELHLSKNQVNDIRPLSKLGNLEDLLLGDNMVDDISPLANLNKLTYLEILNNRIENLSPLEKLTGLTYLDVSGNRISEIDALTKLKGVTRLYLQDNQVTDIKALADLKSIETLFLGNNRISDVSPLLDLAELKILNLSNNLISDLSPLDNSPKLKRISILNNCIKNSDTRIRRKVQFIDRHIVYQRIPCDSPGIRKKIITEEWIDREIKEQCVEFGDNDYTLKSDYKYMSDGIYYFIYLKQGNSTPRQLACKLPWNSKVESLLNKLELIESISGKHELLRFGGNHLYSKDGQVKGFSLANQVKRQEGYDIIQEISDIFQTSYQFEKSQSTKHTILTAKGDGHYIRIIDRGEVYSVEYFEPDFFQKEILGKE